MIYNFSISFLTIYNLLIIIHSMNSIPVTCEKAFCIIFSAIKKKEKRCLQAVLNTEGFRRGLGNAPVLFQTMSLRAEVLSTPVSGTLGYFLLWWVQAFSSGNSHHHLPQPFQKQKYICLMNVSLQFPAFPPHSLLPPKISWRGWSFLASLAPLPGAQPDKGVTPLHTCPAPEEKAMWKGIVMCRVRLTDPSRAFRDLWKHNDCNINTLWCYKVFPNTILKRLPMNQWHHIMKLKLALSLPSFFLKIYIPCNPHNVVLSHKKTKHIFQGECLSAPLGNLFRDIIVGNNLLCFKKQVSENNICKQWK